MFNIFDTKEVPKSVKDHVATATLSTDIMPSTSSQVKNQTFPVYPILNSSLSFASFKFKTTNSRTPWNISTMCMHIQAIFCLNRKGTSYKY